MQGKRRVINLKRNAGGEYPEIERTDKKSLIKGMIKVTTPSDPQSHTSDQLEPISLSKQLKMLQPNKFPNTE